MLRRRADHFRAPTISNHCLSSYRCRSDGASRPGPAEAGRPEYGFLPPGQRTRVTLAKPGTMFVAQPEIPVPLAVEFPFPAWATRSSEAGSVPRADEKVPEKRRPSCLSMTRVKATLLSRGAAAWGAA